MCICIKFWVRLNKLRGLYIGPALSKGIRNPYYKNTSTFLEIIFGKCKTINCNIQHHPPQKASIFQHYQAGFQSDKSTTDQLFALRQIIEKCNEFNITTHQLFIDFKAAYDTIIRNEVYVGMSKLEFPTKFIRFTKATVTIVTCCVKIQNDCSESFETRQGLRQGDVLSTLLFNVVLEVIVRRAKLQTTGTI
jgi:hypothetical protein